MAGDSGSSQDNGTDSEKGSDPNSITLPEGKWARIFRLLLEPFGLWAVQRSLEANKDFPNGFPRIADFITSDPDHLSTVYKRFDTLSVRNLLLLEARVAALEAFQLQLDKEDINIQNKTDNFAVFSTSSSFEYFAYLAYTKENAKEADQEGLRAPKFKENVIPQRRGYGGPLQVAAARGYEDLVRILLEERLEPEYRELGEINGALHAAAAGGHLAVVKLLLERRADVNLKDEVSYNAILAATIGGYKDVVQVLLQHSAIDVNRADKEGNSLIQVAAAGGHKDIVQMLLELEKGANVDACGGKYGTALQVAIESKNEDLVRLLLSFGADVNKKDGEGNTALQTAIKRNNERLVMLLLKYEAAVNEEDKEGKSPLQAAVAAGHQSIVRILLENGADIGARNGKYDNMLESAIEGGYKQVAHLLLKYAVDGNRDSGDHRNRLQPVASRGSESVVTPPLFRSENDEKFRPRTFRSQTDIPECALEEWGKQRWKDARRWEPDPSKKSREEQPDYYFEKRWDVALAIQKALREYQEALLLHAEVLKLSSPTKRTTHTLKGWIGEVESEGDVVERPLQFRDTSAAFHLLDHEKDLISLHPPGDDDNGTKLVARLFNFWLRGKFEPKVEGETITKYSAVTESGVRRFTTILTFYVAIGFLMGAVWLIRRIGLDETDTQTKFLRELVVMTVFTAVFGAWVALFTSARRAEIFGATAAYAAVLIVFVGTNPITPI